MPSQIRFPRYGRVFFPHPTRFAPRFTFPFLTSRSHRFQSADILHLSPQLFENQSVVEYWENFASHAFESTTQSVVSHCVLLKPNGAPVPCTFCFSIRRDIMDLPSIIIGKYPFFQLDFQTTFRISHPSRFAIGQWLPLL